MSSTSLAAARAAAVAHVDAQAEAARLKFITAGYGQALVYALKREEAIRCAADPSPDPSRYPMLSAEVGITAPTLEQVAAVVHAIAAQWTTVAAQIETIRLGAKVAIASAATEADVWAAASVGYPSPSE